MDRGLLFGLTLLVACEAEPAAGHQITGNWGGQHVRLSLTANGGTLEYDCGSGTVEVLRTKRDGAFVAKGTHTPSRGGPVFQGQVLPSYRVRYSGSVRGNAMRLQGRLENGTMLGPFSLRRGTEPSLVRCL